MGNDLDMKFAVIEYSSKTGQIWRHTKERPNYLCDPIKEIDPTSFGCYVSALRGEHIPLTYLIKPSLWKKVVKRITSWWPPGYDISYLSKFDTLLAVHQISNAHEMVRFVKRLKKVYPHITVLGVPTQPHGILRDYLDKNPRGIKSLKEFMAHCDLWLTVAQNTLADQRLMTDTPVEYAPQPYPVEYAGQFFLPREQKDKIIFVAGITDRDNIAKGQLVAAALQKKFPDYEIHVTTIEGVPLDTSNLAGSRYTIIGFDPWRQHLQYLAKVMVVINTDYTQTRGRVQVDCAAVGTPSLGANSDGQVDLFPTLQSQPQTQVEELAQLGERLLTDTEFYNKTVQDAQKEIQKYSYEETAKRMQNIVDRIRLNT